MPYVLRAQLFVRPVPYVQFHLRPVPYIQFFIRPVPYIQFFIRPVPYVQFFLRPVPYIQFFIRPVPYVQFFLRPVQGLHKIFYQVSALYIQFFYQASALQIQSFIGPVPFFKFTWPMTFIDDRRYFIRDDLLACVMQMPFSALLFFPWNRFEPNKQFVFARVC